MNEKLPLGVPPTTYMVERERIMDLSRAINEYVEQGKTGELG